MFKQDFSCPALLIVIHHTKTFTYRAITFFGQPFQIVLLVKMWIKITGLFPFRSPLLRKSQLISFPLGTQMFQFSRFASTILYIQMEIIYLCRLSSLIRKSPGQSLFINSPKLIADYYVLHRLMPPRHPPHALIHLTL